jgi:simple sugar transport system permease protein
MEVVSRDFAPSAGVPYVHALLARIGIEMPQTPLNLAFVWALICCGLVWVYLWRSRGGYELRTAGLSPKAAQYAGISPDRVTIEAMLISGALAGFLGFNEIMGNHRQIVLDFVAGAGFTGIAVALMGRNHPVGIILASVLFGALFQGGSEVAFEIPTITRDMIVVMQGLVILFSGALAYVNRPLLERLWRLYQARRAAQAARTVAPVSPAAAPDAPVALAEETATLAATPAAPEPQAMETTPAPQSASESESESAAKTAADVLEVVEAEIVTMGPGAAAPAPAPRRKRGPKKSKRKPGEV